MSNELDNYEQNPIPNQIPDYHGPTGPEPMPTEGLQAFTQSAENPNSEPVPQQVEQPVMEQNVQPMPEQPQNTPVEQQNVTAEQQYDLNFGNNNSPYNQDTTTGFGDADKLSPQQLEEQQYAVNPFKPKTEVKPEVDNKKKEKKKGANFVLILIILALVIGGIIGFKIYSNGKKPVTPSHNRVISQNTTDNNETENQKIKMILGQYVYYRPSTTSETPFVAKKEWTGTEADITMVVDTTVNWKLLSINEDGSIDIIAAEPTSVKLPLKGAIGYNNGVYLINEACKNLYGNDLINATARSINIEDITSRLNATGKEKFSILPMKQTFTGNRAYYPNLYANEIGSGVGTQTTTTRGCNTSDAYISAPEENANGKRGYSSKNSTLTVTQTAYYARSTDGLYFDNLVFNDIFFSTKSPNWIATRFVNIDQDNNCAQFGIRIQNGTGLNLYSMFDSNTNEYVNTYGLRPVVRIPSYEVIDGTGTKENPFIVY